VNIEQEGEAKPRVNQRRCIQERVTAIWSSCSSLNGALIKNWNWCELTKGGKEVITEKGTPSFEGARGVVQKRRKETRHPISVKRRRTGRPTAGIRGKTLQVKRKGGRKWSLETARPSRD